MITEKLIEKHIEGLPHRSAGYKQLIRELGLHGSQRRELEEKLAEMVQRGKLILTDRDRYSLPVEAAKRNLAVGRLAMHRDGYGFVIPDSKELRNQLGSDIFISSSEIGSAMHGDHVLVELKGHPGDGRTEGRILRITGRANQTVVGIFHYGPRSHYVRPLDERVTGDVMIPRGMERPVESDLEAAEGEEEITWPKPSPTENHDSSHDPGEPAGRRKKVSSRSADRILGHEARRREWDDMEGLVVEAEILEWPGATQGAKGRVIEILGYEDDFGVDVEIVTRKHHLPHRFPLEALAEAQSIEAVIPGRELRRRRDFRNLPIITIDGETARDFDDAVTVSRLENGHYELQVHIADVAHYVHPDSPMDREARWRGTSVYFPDRAIPMLPVELSTGICTLAPQAERLVMSCLMEIDGTGEIVGYELCPGVIRSAERMTYTNVALVLDGDATARSRYAALVERFELMEELALILAEKRERRGSIDFDLPEPVIEFDEHGLMRGVARSERNMAHRIIEEFMLAANEAVASYLENKRIASLYRVHQKPEARRVLEFETLAAAFGYSLGVGAMAVERFTMHSDRRANRGTGRRSREVEVPKEVHITPRMYQKLTNKIEGKPEERILSYLMLRSLPQARYSENNQGHFALAATTYTHFTSPIRRYPDLIVHRILKAVLAESAERHDGDVPVGVGGPVLQNPHPSKPTSLAEDPVLLETPNRTVKNSPEKHADLDSPWSRPMQKRRQNDNHRAPVKAAEPLGGPIPEDTLHEIAEDTSFTERRADEAERELLDWKKAKFMHERLGDEFDGLIVSVTKFGIFVELNELFIEGLVPLALMNDDRYTYHENTRQIIGQQSKRTYSMGDRVRVLVDRVDPVQHKVQFALVQEPSARGQRRHRKA